MAGKYGEPWKIDYEAIPWSKRQKSPFDDEGAGISDCNNEEVVVGGSQDEQGGAIGVLDNTRANRIVSCVNALEGFDPEAVAEVVSLLAWGRTHVGGLISNLKIQPTDAVSDALTVRQELPLLERWMRLSETALANLKEV